jgi:secreted trypsin-like serine protease
MRRTFSTQSNNSPNNRPHRRIRVLAAAVTAVVVAALGVWLAPTASAVADGQDVPDNRYAFAAALSMPLITRPDGSTYSSACSGALIAPSWVITAGHCAHDGARNRINGEPRYEIDIMVDSPTRSGHGQNRRAVEVVQSPTHDVALLRLDRPVFGVVPVFLSRNPPKPGDVLRLAGWGSIDAEADLTHRPDRLQTGQVEIDAVSQTDVLVHGLAPHPTTSACPYDSGAPYFRRVGVVFFLVATEVEGPDCPHDQDETTARIDTIANWITAQILGH